MKSRFKFKLIIAAGCLLLMAFGAVPSAASPVTERLPPHPAGWSGNPVFPGWYADPDVIVADGKYWIYATSSLDYDKQLYFDAFSSPDLVSWHKHSQVLVTGAIKWVKRALWAPSVIAKDGKYYLFFAANDIHSDRELGGIGVAVADQPAGPFHDLIGKPLIGKFENHAQPIDPSVFKDPDGTYYLLYGGWKHLNVARLRDDFKAIVPLPDGSLFKNITPAHYVEGPLMFVRHGKYYLMWSEGDWVGAGYSVSYATADSPLGPFKRVGKILKTNPRVATGTGGNTVIHTPNSDKWYIVYHRHPLGDSNPNHRVVCIDRMVFDKQGLIKPVKVTFKGVAKSPLPIDGK